MLLLVDELSLASPPLFAGISRRAFHGRARSLRLVMDDILDHPFGDVLVQVLMGDFLQLNPVKSHTLIEAFCCTPVPGVPDKTQEEDRDGYSLFRRCCRNVVVFTGTQRFLDDDLPALLDIMRTPGGRVVPDDLKGRILAQVQAGPEDPRCKPEYTVEGCPGFFAFGAHASIQWEQVTRSMNLRVQQMARRSSGPTALCNLPDGSPNMERRPVRREFSADRFT